MQSDAHCGGRASDRPGRSGYLINSLYLDTPNLAFHNAKVRGDPDRIKLRVRTYSPTSKVTLEIKRRHSEIINKTRVVVDRTQVVDAAMGKLTPRDGESSDALYLNDFARTLADSGALPTLTVQYEREAYESVVDHYARVTFDRRIRVRRARDWELCPPELDWHSFDEYWRTDHPTLPAVLELKCETSAVPFWLMDIIRENELPQTSFSKYSIGIALTQWRYGGEIAPNRSPARALEVVT